MKHGDAVAELRLRLAELHEARAELARRGTMADFLESVDFIIAETEQLITSLEPRRVGGAEDE